MSESFDHTFDVVVVGTGAAGFATAMGAADEGLSAVLLEGTDRWGGSTSMSGGGMWLPDNPLMQRDKAGDSRDEALAYLEATVGDDYRATSRQRKEAFVDSVGDFVRTAQRYGIRLTRAADYPDYYPELPGGKIGRAVEVEPFDTRRIGDWWSSCRQQTAMPIKTDDVWLLGRAWSTVGGVVRGAELVVRALSGAVKRQHLAGIGAGLACSLLETVVIRQHVPLWLDAPLIDLIVRDGRVVGGTTTKDGTQVSVGARRGVMLAAGGFDHNVEWRRRYHGIDGASSGNPGNLGGAIEIAQRFGAAVELMDDAWWGGSVAPVAASDPSFIVGERSFPYSVMVDARGDRFANESESYVDLGHHMLDHDPGGDYWLVTDSRHTIRYLRSYAMDPRHNKAMAEAGVVKRADTLPELATSLGMEPSRLVGAVSRFNGYARAGVDGAYGRGNSAYDRYYGDPTVHPNPNLGPLERGPFTAVKVVIGDLGTKGGVVTDADSRALRSDGTVIDGLFSAGNCSASVMGRTYPGPGSTIGPAVVFGLRAARFMARN